MARHPFEVTRWHLGRGSTAPLSQTVQLQGEIYRDRVWDRKQRDSKGLNDTPVHRGFFSPCGLYSFIHWLMCSSHSYRVPKQTGNGMLATGVGFAFKQTCSICSSTIPLALRGAKSLGFLKPQLPTATEHGGWSEVRPHM